MDEASGGFDDLPPIVVDEIGKGNSLRQLIRVGANLLFKFAGRGDPRLRMSIADIAKNIGVSADVARETAREWKRLSKRTDGKFNPLEVYVGDEGAEYLEYYLDEGEMLFICTKLRGEAPESITWEMTRVYRLVQHGILRETSAPPRDISLSDSQLQHIEEMLAVANRGIAVQVRADLASAKDEIIATIRRESRGTSARITRLEKRARISEEQSKTGCVHSDHRAALSRAVSLLASMESNASFPARAWRSASSKLWHEVMKAAGWLDKVEFSSVNGLSAAWAYLYRRGGKRFKRELRRRELEQTLKEESISDGVDWVNDGRCYVPDE